MFALDAATGKILWSSNAGSSVISGPSMVDGTIYWGAGYTYLGLPMFTRERQALRVHAERTVTRR
jgi:outer membrane protein assembly factor BamB